MGFIIFKKSLRVLLLLILGGWTYAKGEIVVVVSAADQRMALVEDGVVRGKFPVSTSRFGLGDSYGSYATPTGWLKVAEKIGGQAKEGTVFKQRRPTGEVLPVNAQGRDPIVTRIIWLKGTEPQNQNSYRRCIYIHGTPEERWLGQPVSWGCIRMASKDVVTLFERIGVGTRVEISDKSIRKAVRELGQETRLAFGGRRED